MLDAFENIDRLDESFLRGLLARHSSGLWVLPGPLRMERTQLNGEQVRAGLEIIRSHFDNVVLDLRHDTAPGTFAGLEASDTIMFLPVSRIRVAVRRGRARGVPSARARSPKVKVVVMREDTGEDVTLKHAREALGVPVYWRTPSDYQAVVSAINGGKPVVTASPRSKFARNLRQLADMLASGGSGRQGGHVRLETCELIAGDGLESQGPPQEPHKWHSSSDGAAPSPPRRRRTARRGSRSAPANRRTSSSRRGSTASSSSAST